MVKKYYEYDFYSDNVLIKRGYKIIHQQKYRKILFCKDKTLSKISREENSFGNRHAADPGRGGTKIPDNSSVGDSIPTKGKEISNANINDTACCSSKWLCSQGKQGCDQTIIRRASKHSDSLGVDA